jgi:hypothetical protein
LIAGLALPGLAACATGAAVGNGFDAAGLGTSSGTTAGEGGIIKLPSSSSSGSVVFVGDDAGSGSGTGTSTATAAGGNDASTGTDTGTSSSSSSSGSCIDNETMCDGECTDTTSDPDNCGSCGKMCSSSVCTNSMCESDSGGDDGGLGFDSGGGGGYTCSHSPCTTGAPLMDGCDDGIDGSATGVCDDLGLTQCCTQQWSSECVQAVMSACIFHHVDICNDPGC